MATNSSQCVADDNLLLYNQVTVAPALFIILLSILMKKRVNSNKCCSRGGILPPVDFLRVEDNRFSYAMAYNSTTVCVFSLFVSSVLGNENFGIIAVYGPPWLQGFESIINVLYVVVINIPFFLALNMTHKITGAILGFFYTLFRLSILTVTLFGCSLAPFSYLAWWPVLMVAPLFASHLFLSIRFLVIFGQEIHRKIKRRKCKAYAVSQNDEQDIMGVAGKDAIKHVRLLLNPTEEGLEPWYIKVRNAFYKPRPEFKYSVQIIATVIVASVMIYEFFIALGAGLVGNLWKIKNNMIENEKELIQKDVFSKDTIKIILLVIDISIPTLLGTISFSLLFMYFQMYRLLIAHRSHVIKMSRSDKKFLPRSLSTPEMMVGYCLRYCGYQIAYLVWGFITLVLCLVLIVAALTAIVVLLILREDVQEFAKNVALGALPAMVVTLLVWIFQSFLASFVFKHRKLRSKSAITIDNRQLFLLASFFFFFFNIIVGLLTCILRIIIGMVLGIFFLGRIDRPLLMKGFHILDFGYMAYLGFLHVQVAHKHPVLLVFCHLILDNDKRFSPQKRGIKVTCGGHFEMMEAINVTADISSSSERPRVSQAAYNRWFVALTLMRNPSLVPNRKKFFRSVILKSPVYNDLNDGQTS